MPRSFLRMRLPWAARSAHRDALLVKELSDSTERSSLRSLTAGVGVNLSIEHEDIHVLTRSNHVVETTVTDVVRSTVATDDPL